jgi:hypothetical protein
MHVVCSSSSLPSIKFLLTVYIYYSYCCKFDISARKYNNFSQKLPQQIKKGKAIPVQALRVPGC